MRYLLGCFVLLFVLGTQLANASTLTVTCSEPKGRRVDYFTHNNVKRDNNEFIESEDGVSKGQIILIWDESKKAASLVLNDSASAGGQANTFDIYPIYHEHDQITFAGIFKGAPVMISIYPLDKVAIYSLHSVWLPLVGQGVRAMIFYAKCNLNIT